MTYQDITTAMTAGILTIHLNRPKQLNALNHAVLQELEDCFSAAKKDPKVRAILITGEGKAFCAGADITELAQLTGEDGFEFARYGQKVFTDLAVLGKPSLAAINGYALGGGCELAMAATLRIASNAAVFSQPEIKLGVIPGFGGTQRLARLIGKGRALYLCLTGKRFSAEEALEWGLVSEVTTSEELLASANRLLAGLIDQSAAALRGIISSIEYGYDLSLPEALELEAAHFGVCCSTADKEEGVRAFLEKRPAQFKGTRDE